MRGPERQAAHPTSQTPRERRAEVSGVPTSALRPRPWSVTEGRARLAGACSVRESWPGASHPPLPPRPPRAPGVGRQIALRAPPARVAPSGGFQQQRVLVFWFWGSDACPGSLWAKIRGRGAAFLPRGPTGPSLALPSPASRGRPQARLRVSPTVKASRGQSL